MIPDFQLPNRRVLIIDDNDAIHEDFRKILSLKECNQSLADEEAALFGTPQTVAAAGAGVSFELDSAFQGQEGLAKVEEALRRGRPFALAFVDVRMPPGWDGVETIPHLWRADPSLQIVICSAYSDHSWGELVSRLGLSDRLLILKKPFDAIEVRQLGVALTEKWSLARQAVRNVQEVEQLVDARTRELECARSELETARNAAEEANRAKTAFLANISHEIRTPMTAILGYAENLQDAEISVGERREAADAILRNGQHLLTILNDVLDITKIEAGRMTVERIPCSPLAIANQVVDLLRARAQSRGLSLSMEALEPIPGTILCDPTRLRQILMNLVGNAIKFTHSGSVRIVASFHEHPSDGPRLTFDVVDTGIGMTPEQADAAFEPFQQGDLTTTRVYGGTGLGLHISRRLAMMLGGDVYVVESAPNRGTRMRVTILAVAIEPSGPVPDASTCAGSAAASTPAPPAPPLRDRRVLLAEDGADNQRLIATILARAGARVELAANGRVAVERALEAGARGDPFDIILMDMQMPEMDGYAATRLLRKEGYAGAIVALTAHAMAGDREKCVEAGCDDYATKPIDRADLIRKLCAVCDAPHETATGR